MGSEGWERRPRRGRRFGAMLLPLTPLRLFRYCSRGPIRPSCQSPLTMSLA